MGVHVRVLHVLDWSSLICIMYVGTGMCTVSGAAAREIHEFDAVAFGLKSEVRWDGFFPITYSLLYKLSVDWVGQ